MAEAILNSRHGGQKKIVTSSGGNIKSGLETFKKNWFTEVGNLEKTFAWSIHIKMVLYHMRSKFEDILIFDSERFGRCLALDESIRCTEKDEFVISEMSAFLSLNSHPHPGSVLVVGGRNAGIVREATKHPYVERVVLCEPDGVLIDACKKYVPFLNDGLQSPKLSLVLEDSTQYLKTTREEFDVIIVDFLDAKENVSTIESTSFKAFNAALKPGGILVLQVSCFWFDANKSKEFIAKCRTVFPVVDYASAVVPSVPGGQRGILLCGTSTGTNFREPIHKFTDEKLKNFLLKFYTPAVQRAAFALPESIREELGLKAEQ